MGAFLGIRKTLFADDLFSLSILSVRTDGVLTVAEMGRLSGLRLGSNTLALDLDTVTRKLESDRRIREANVTRILPNQVLIQVKERREFLRVREPARGRMLTLDPDGFFLGPAPPDSKLPFLEDMRVGSQGWFAATGYRDRRELERIARLKDLLSGDPLFREKSIRGFRIESAGRVTVLFDGPFELRLGEEFEKELKKLTAVWQTLTKELDLLEYVDLRFHDIVAKRKEIRRSR